MVVLQVGSLCVTKKSFWGKAERAPVSLVFIFQKSEALRTPCMGKGAGCAV